MAGEEKQVKRICNSCGVEVEPDSAFCRHCGSNLTDFKEKPSTSQERKKEGIDYAKPAKEPNFMAIGGMVAIVVVIIIVLLAVTVDWSPQRNIAGYSVHPYEVGGLEGETGEVVVSPDASGFSQGIGDGYHGRGGGEGPDPKGESNWAYDLGNSILGSPVYGSGIVYVASTELAGGGMYTSGLVIPDYRTFITALASNTGELKWKYEAPGTSKVDSVEMFVDGVYVYCILQVRDEGVMIVKLDSSRGGTSSWDKPVAIARTRSLGASLGKGALLVSTVSENDGTYRVRAYDLETGVLHWGLATEGEPGPPVGLPDGFVCTEVDANKGAHLVFRTMAGEEVSRYILGFTRPIGRPVVTRDKVVASGMWSFGRVMVECYDISSLGGDPLWRWDARIPGEDPPPAGFVVLGGACYFISPTGRMIALSLENGDELPLEDELDYGFVAPPVSNGSIVSSVTESGLACAVSSGKTPALKWFAYLPSGLTPIRGRDIAYGDGRLFFPCRNGVLVALE